MKNIAKAIKKVAAISMGAVMLGATITGALAADLSNYPSPFVVGGAYNDAAVIYSSNGLDTDAAMNVIAGLATALTPAAKKVGEVAEVTGGFKIEKSGNKLNFHENITNVQTTALDKQDLPDLLQDLTYRDNKGENNNEVTYKQKLTVDPDTKLLFDLDGDDDGDKVAGYYLKIPNNQRVYVYNLTFNTKVLYDNTTATKAKNDIKGTTLEMQNKKYVITSVGTATAGNKIDKLTMLAGDSVQLISQGETVNGVTVIDVDESETKCIVKYGGEEVSIDKDKIYSFADGLRVGITDVTAMHETGASADMCEMIVGADELVLENAKELKRNQDDISGSLGHILYSSTASDANKYLLGLDIQYTAKDDIYLGSPTDGDEWVDTIFGNWKFVFAGTTWDSAEEIKIDAGDDQGTVTFTNNEGKLVELPIYLNDSEATKDNVFFGDGKDWNDYVLIGPTDGWDCNKDTADNNDCIGLKFLYTDSNGAAHVLELKDITTTKSSPDKNQTSFRDVTYGVDYNDLEFVFDNSDGGSAEVFKLGSTGNISLNISSTGVIDVLGLDAKVGKPIQTLNDGRLFFALINSSDVTGVGFRSTHANATRNQRYARQTAAIGNVSAMWFWENDIETGKNQSIIAWMYEDPTETDDEINVNFGVEASPTHGNAAIYFTSSGIKESKSNTDILYYISEYGTVFEHDDKNKQYLKITHPEGQAYANVYVVPQGAATATVVTGTASQPAQMNDTEVSNVAQYNAIVVGGPCANKIAAELMGAVYYEGGCEAGFTLGEAVIELVNNDGKVAMIVAGMSKQDTANAAKVLQSYKANAAKLTGSSVTVKGTTVVSGSVA